jgi:hypothetical protein
MEKSERQGAFVIVFLLLLAASFAFDGWQFVQVVGGDHALLSADAMR